MLSGGKNQEVHKSGGTTVGVVDSTPYLTVHLQSAILTEINHVVVGEDGVLAQHMIVLVVTAQTTSLKSGGKNQGGHKSGGTTAGVVVTTLYQMVHQQSVILVEINRVVVLQNGVVTHLNIVPVVPVQTTSL